mgnify:CR=1 FL=1
MVIYLGNIPLANTEAKIKVKLDKEKIQPKRTNSQNQFQIPIVLSSLTKPKLVSNWIENRTIKPELQYQAYSIHEIVEG